LTPHVWNVKIHMWRDRSESQFDFLVRRVRRFCRFRFGVGGTSTRCFTSFPNFSSLMSASKTSGASFATRARKSLSSLFINFWCPCPSVFPSLERDKDQDLLRVFRPRIEGSDVRRAVDPMKITGRISPTREFSSMLNFLVRPDSLVHHFNLDICYREFWSQRLMKSHSVLVGSFQ